jgi:hypothetical protein
MKRTIIGGLLFLLAAQVTNAQQAAGFSGNSLHSIPGSHGASDKKDTVGTIFFLNDYCKGTVINKYDSMVPGNLLYNYNKLTGDLLMTTGEGNVYYDVDKEQVKAFTLSASGADYSFEKVACINKDDLFEVIAKGTNYSVYKLVKVFFKKPDFHSAGLTETGNKYAEYIDESKYYFVDNKANTAKQFELKKRSVASAFGAEKTNAFAAMHKQDDLDEAYLKKLAAFVNE